MIPVGCIIAGICYNQQRIAEETQREQKRKEEDRRSRIRRNEDKNKRESKDKKVGGR